MAVQPVVELGLNVQVKSVDAPAMSVERPPVQVVQPVPVTFTPVNVESPEFVSVTVIVTDVPASMFPAGETLFFVSVVDGMITITVT